MILEPFSAGYYLGTPEVVGFGGTGAVVGTEEYELLEAQIFRKYDKFGLPVFVKLDRGHYPLRPEAGIPRDTLAVGADVSAELDTEPAKQREVLVPNEDSTKLLIDWENRY